MTITITYTSIDRCRVRRSFKTIAGARAFAQKYVGPYPEQGSTYAVSGDGVGKVTWDGCTFADLFGTTQPEPEAPPAQARPSYHLYGGARVDDDTPVGPHCLLAWPDDEIPF